MPDFIVSVITLASVIALNVSDYQWRKRQAQRTPRGGRS